ncbi:large conductance mechanosensitive channel protein MscL [Pseudalkalibacillus caeni]|uniref:Large-conductance mechanosensitive channel n=1 Tax=Exobacillus caeni TaxID=2574798 RepID=A0A5R9EXP2_9BACL|nr:large conductance mechanosensitive channel protein MscL [Pseudalkalibacillus caeni]TLS34936.1 large conductance mechanosensitive channel protein MscL [Pseudalkalibacillus caeni]
MIKEFKQFAMKGSVADMGIGMVLGAAFGSLIDSLVNDVLLPPIGLIFAKVNFTDLYVSLSGKTYASLADAKEAGAATINYGIFFSSLLRFGIVMFAVFLVIRQINRLKKPYENPLESMTNKECPYCCTSIPYKAIKCPNCGSELEPEEQLERASSFSKKKKQSFRISFK